MSTMASQIISLTIVYSTVYSRRRSKKHQSSASLEFVRAIHRWPVNSPHKGPVTRKMFPFDDVIMKMWYRSMLFICILLFPRWNMSTNSWLHFHPVTIFIIRHTLFFIALLNMDLISEVYFQINNISNSALLSCSFHAQFIIRQLAARTQHLN